MQVGHQLRDGRGPKEPALRENHAWDDMMVYFETLTYVQGSFEDILAALPVLLRQELQSENFRRRSSILFANLARPGEDRLSAPVVHTLSVVEFVPEVQKLFVSKPWFSFIDHIDVALQLLHLFHVVRDSDDMNPINRGDLHKKLPRLRRSALLRLQQTIAIVEYLENVRLDEKTAQRRSRHNQRPRPSVSFASQEAFAPAISTSPTEVYSLSTPLSSSPPSTLSAHSSISDVKEVTESTIDFHISNSRHDESSIDTTRSKNQHQNDFNANTLGSTPVEQDAELVRDLLDFAPQGDAIGDTRLNLKKSSYDLREQMSLVSEQLQKPITVNHFSRNLAETENPKPKGSLDPSPSSVASSSTSLLPMPSSALPMPQMTIAPESSSSSTSSPRSLHIDPQRPPILVSMWVIAAKKLVSPTTIGKGSSSSGGFGSSTSTRTDPFVAVFLDVGEERGLVELARSSVKRRTVNPKWNDEKILSREPIPFIGSDVSLSESSSPALLRARILDNAAGGHCMGEVTIDLCRDIPQAPRGKKYDGELHKSLPVLPVQPDCPLAGGTLQIRIRRYQSQEDGTGQNSSDGDGQRESKKTEREDTHTGQGLQRERTTVQRNTGHTRRPSSRSLSLSRAASQSPSSSSRTSRSASVGRTSSKSFPSKTKPETCVLNKTSKATTVDKTTRLKVTKRKDAVKRLREDRPPTSDRGSDESKNKEQVADPADSGFDDAMYNALNDASRRLVWQLKSQASSLSNMSKIFGYSDDTSSCKVGSSHAVTSTGLDNSVPELSDEQKELLLEMKSKSAAAERELQQQVGELAKAMREAMREVPPSSNAATPEMQGRGATGDVHLLSNAAQRVFRASRDLIATAESPSSSISLFTAAKTSDSNHSIPKKESLHPKVSKLKSSKPAVKNLSTSMVPQKAAIDIVDSSVSSKSVASKSPQNDSGNEQLELFVRRVYIPIIGSSPTFESLSPTAFFKLCGRDRSKAKMHPMHSAGVNLRDLKAALKAAEVDYLLPKNNDLRLALKAVDHGTFAEASLKAQVVSGAAGGVAQQQISAVKRGGHDVSFEYWSRAHLFVKPAVSRLSVPTKSPSVTIENGELHKRPTGIGTRTITALDNASESKAPVQPVSENPTKKVRGPMAQLRKKEQERKRVLDEWQSKADQREAIVREALEVLGREPPEGFKASQKEKEESDNSKNDKKLKIKRPSKRSTLNNSKGQGKKEKVAAPLASSLQHSTSKAKSSDLKLAHSTAAISKKINFGSAVRAKSTSLSSSYQRILKEAKSPLATARIKKAGEIRPNVVPVRNGDATF